MPEPFTRADVVDGFLADPRPLRRAFDRAVDDRADPLDPVRFRWEYWNVPGQFSQHRAPARAVLGDAADAFEARLFAWARRRLGLARLASPAWLSFLVDGQYQGIHRDGPNGDVAFSFGLSWPRTPRFRGGETLLARMELLDYFGTSADRPERASDPLFDEIPSRFNRLVAFDARLPHMVGRVEGPHQAREGRVAIQGWLVPGGILAGERAPGDLGPVVASRLRSVKLDRGAYGLVTFALDIRRDGAVRAATPLLDLLVPGAPGRAALERALGALRFGPGPRDRVVVPVRCAGGRARLDEGP